MQDGIYYKNMGNNKFEKKSLAPLFRQAINLRGADFDNDGVNDFLIYTSIKKMNLETILAVI